jgi:hypothetical protein
VGGIVGNLQGSLERVEARGTIGGAPNLQVNRIGGIVGVMVGNASVVDARVVGRLEGDERIGGIVGEADCSGAICALTRTLSIVDLEVLRDGEGDGVVGFLTGTVANASVVFASDGTLIGPVGPASVGSTIQGVTSANTSVLHSTTAPALDAMRASLAWVHEEGSPPRLRFAESAAFLP